MADEITLERDIDEILGGAQTVQAADQDDAQAPAPEPEDDEDSEDGDRRGRGLALPRWQVEGAASPGRPFRVPRSAGAQLAPNPESCTGHSWRPTT